MISPSVVTLNPVRLSCMLSDKIPLKTTRGTVETVATVNEVLMKKKINGRLIIAVAKTTLKLLRFFRQNEKKKKKPKRNSLRSTKKNILSKCILKKTTTYDSLRNQYSHILYGAEKRKALLKTK